MSIIVPAGNKKVDWSPKEETMVKTASTGAEVKEEVNALYEAAKSYVEAKAAMCKECKKPMNLCSCDKSDAKSDAKSDVKSDAKAEVKADVKTAGSSEVKPDSAVKSDSASSDSTCGLPPPADVVTEPVAEEVGEVSKMEAAVEKIDEAVVELKEVVQEEKGETGEATEVEFEVSDDKVTDIPGKGISDSEIIVESTPALPCACADTKKEVTMDKAAATEEEFCRFAKLSPANRKKLGDYWVNMLGFPKDYVSLMVKDYEK